MDEFYSDSLVGVCACICLCYALRVTEASTCMKGRFHLFHSQNLFCVWAFVTLEQSDKRKGGSSWNYSGEGQPHLMFAMATGTLLGTLLVSVKALFAFRSAPFLHGTDSIKCWKHSEILVHVDMTSSHSCCWLDSCMVRISCSPTSQRFSVGLR